LVSDWSSDVCSSDLPFTVRDVEIDGTWKRILVGTTGLGTPQSVKP
jgi:Tfp pilus tip-associated adhesin PilY1